MNVWLPCRHICLVRQAGAGHLKCSTNVWITCECLIFSSSEPTESRSDFPESLVHVLCAPIKPAAAATETYYSSKCCKIDLSRHIVTQNSKPFHKPPVAGSLPQCLPAIERAQKDLISSWESSSGAAAVKMRAPLCHSNGELVSFPKLCVSGAISSSGE